MACKKKDNVPVSDKKVNILTANASDLIPTPVLLPGNTIVNLNTAQVQKNLDFNSLIGKVSSFAYTPPSNVANLQANTRTLAIGKRKIILERGSFGPPLSERSTGLNFPSHNSEVDSLRIVAGYYWTISEDGSQLIYLLGQARTPLNISDFNLNKERILTLDDIPINYSLETSFHGPMDNILYTQLKKDRKSYLGTQQFVLLKADKGFFMNFDSKPTAGQNDKPSVTLKDEAPPIFKSFTLPPTNTVTYNSLGVYDVEKWKSFVNGDSGFNAVIEQGRIFYDYAFELNTPFSDKEIRDFSGINSPLVASVVPTYNFYIKEYEEGSKNIQEILLPNLYAIMNEINTGKSNKDLRNIITLNGLLDPKDITIGVRTPDKDKRPTVRGYFNKFAREHFAANRERLIPSEETVRKRLVSELETSSKKFANVVIPYEKVSIFKDYEDKKYMFPMFTDLDIPTDRITVLAEILKDSQMSSTLITKVLGDNVSGTGFNKLSVSEVTEVSVQGPNSKGEITTRNSFSFDNQVRNYWNIDQWLQDFDQEDNKTNSYTGREGLVDPTDIAIFLSDNKDANVSNIKNPQYMFVRNLLKIIFIGKLRTLLKQKFRTYEELMSGKKAYSETVLYRIEKISNSGVVQNVYFPNSNEVNVLRYVDTQVKYGVQYTYNIYSYQAVIGSSYAYSELTVQDNQASFRVVQKPSVILVEIPYYTYTGTVIDSPPVPPEVDLIPYKGVNNRILMNMNGNTGEYLMDPITITAEDEIKINTYRRIKGLRREEKILFSSDDHSGVFQIFRMDSKPFSYKDFNGHLIAAVNTDVSAKTEQGATSAAFIDRIKPNIKYYYTFRVFDNHGHFSNPSPLYEVEMVDQTGTIYPVVNVVDFAERIEKTSVKTMRRFIKIKPTFAQSVINEEKSQLLGLDSVRDVTKVTLGTEDESPWGNTYKIRLTSRQSGKVIDLNIYFENGAVRTKTINDL